MTSFFQGFLLPLLGLEPLGTKLNAISGILTQSLTNETCNSDTPDSCRDTTSALSLKLVAIASILVSSAAGIAIPLLTRRTTNAHLFTAAKAFAAGVILATGFVHMLPDAAENLTDSCLPTYPWKKFPFSGFVAMMAALLTLMADFVGTQMYESKKNEEEEEDENGLKDGLVVVKEDGSCEKHVVQVYDDAHGHGHGHSHGHGFDGDASARNVVVAQVLEVGIVSHSILIGLSLGVSHSPCTIKPLIAALSFHQFFEGFALGGCIAQAGFKQISTIIMACFFTLTTPGGIAVGIAVASSYNPSSVRALVVEGILDSISAGILIYMALVDLIAADFMSKKMRSNSRLQIVSYSALFLGASLMAALAIWS